MARAERRRRIEWEAPWEAHHEQASGVVVCGAILHALREHARGHKLLQEALVVVLAEDDAELAASACYELLEDVHLGGERDD